MHLDNQLNVIEAYIFMIIIRWLLIIHDGYQVVINLSVCEHGIKWFLPSQLQKKEKHGPWYYRDSR